ncbi:MAG: hypothetical protein WB802_14790, partial [Candidatus Dormiibacterota bacterium]
RNPDQPVPRRGSLGGVNTGAPGRRPGPGKEDSAMSPYCTYELFQAQRLLTAAERREVDARVGRLAALISGWWRRVIVASRSRSGTPPAHPRAQIPHGDSAP